MAQSPTNTELADRGTPDPLNFKRHRPVAGPFAQTTVLDAVAATSTIIDIAGCLVVRLRGLFSGAGTLSFAYVRPPPNTGTVYAVALGPPHADEIVVGAAEFMVDIEPSGECYLRITWTPGAASTVNFLDVMSQ